MQLNVAFEQGILKETLNVLSTRQISEQIEGIYDFKS
jgi:hypothetical protein